MLCCPHCSDWSTILFSIGTPDSDSTILFTVVDKIANNVGSTTFNLVIQELRIFRHIVNSTTIV